MEIISFPACSNRDGKIVQMLNMQVLLVLLGVEVASLAHLYRPSILLLPPNNRQLPFRLLIVHDQLQIRNQ